MGAYFAFEQVSPAGELKRFVFQLIEDKKIEHARDIIAGIEKTKVHVQGTVVPTRMAYNPDWSFHLDPLSVDFFEVQIEVCDANVAHVEEHLDEVGGSFLPRSFWCPWSSRVVAEVTL